MTLRSYIRVNPSGRSLALTLQTPRKVLAFYRTEDGFWPDFADIKHDYTQEFYWSYSSFITQCPRTGLATCCVTRRHLRCIHWKCLRLGDTLILNNSMDTKYSWKPQTHLTGWIFISSFQFWVITPLCRFMIFSKKDFPMKLFFTLLLILTDVTVSSRRHFSWRECVMVVPP